LRDIIEVDWNDIDSFADDLQTQIGALSESVNTLFTTDLYQELEEIQNELVEFWNKTDVPSAEDLFHDIREEVKELSANIANVSQQIIEDGKLPEHIIEDLVEFREDVVEFFKNVDAEDLPDVPSPEEILSELSQISDLIWNTTVHLQGDKNFSEIIYNDLLDIKHDLAELVNSTQMPSFDDLVELSDSIFDSDLLSNMHRGHWDWSGLNSKVANITNTWFGHRLSSTLQCRQRRSANSMSRYHLDTAHRVIAFRGMVFEWGVAPGSYSIGPTPYYPECQVNWEAEPAGSSSCHSQDLVAFTESYSMTYGNYNFITNNCHHYANRLVALLTSAECGLSKDNNPQPDDTWWDDLINIFEDSSEEDQEDRSDEVLEIQ